MLEEQNFIRKDSIEDRSDDINIFLHISPILLENIARNKKKFLLLIN